MILVTHDPSHLHKADRVFYIKDGSIVKVANQKEDKHHGYEAFKEAPVAEAAASETAVSKLAQLYPDLSREQLLSKLLVHDALVPYSLDIMIKTEEIITKYIQQEIRADELYDMLDQSTAKGGISLYEPTAHKLITSVMKVSKEFKITGSPEQVKRVFTMLLDEHPVILSAAQKKNFRLHLEAVLTAQSSLDAFFEQLDASLETGGVGLNKRTALHFREKVALLLAGAS